MLKNKSGLLILLGILAIIFNTILSLTLDGYEIERSLMGSLSLVTSTGLLFFLCQSTRISGGFKVFLFCLFCFTAIVKFSCCILYDNLVALLIALGVLLLEISIYAICLMLSK